MISLEEEYHHYKNKFNTGNIGGVGELTGTTLINSKQFSQPLLATQPQGLQNYADRVVKFNKQSNVKNTTEEDDMSSMGNRDNEMNIGPKYNFQYGNNNINNINNNISSNSIIIITICSKHL